MRTFGNYIKTIKSMLDQLLQLAQQYGGDAIAKNSGIPTEIKDNLLKETGSSIFSGLKDIASEGNTEQLISLFQGNNASSASNPVIKNLIGKVSGSLGQKFDLESSVTNNFAGELIPKVLGSLVGDAKSGKGLNIQDIIMAISGGNGGNILDTLAKLGLDQNGDGKLDLQDAVSALSGGNKKGKSSGSLGGILGKLFGK